MAHRHLMAVCVVCLLCAEHFPCKAHVLANNNNNNIDSIGYNDLLSKLNNHNYRIQSINDVAAEQYYDKSKDRRNEMITRKKRHADHSESPPASNNFKMPEVTKNYLEKTIRQFSQNQTSMNIHAFEKMITQLNLNYLFNTTLHNKNNNSKTCLSKENFLSKMVYDKDDDHHSHDGHDHHKHNEHDHNDHHNHDEHDHHSQEESDNHENEHDHDHDHQKDMKISTENLMSMCPLIVYNLLNRDTKLGDSCFEEADFIAPVMDIASKVSYEEDRSRVWLFSTLCVITIGLCGLIGVIVVPIMDKHYYHLILQFLVALAVGTMTGDTLLHLLPHAMLPLSPDQDLHKSMMYRGLMIFSCIVFSYFFERFIASIMEYRQRKEKRGDKNPKKHIRVVRESESTAVNPTTCKHKYSSYPYCYDEINLEAMGHNDEKEEMLSPKDKDNIVILQNDTKKINGLIHENSNDVDNTTLSTSLDGSIDGGVLFNNGKNACNPISNSASVNAKIEEHNDERTTTVILREHQSKHHGHSHTHGHVHSPPESLSAVAWMVILGDGLHNFTDGMAIGAAFSISITGGFSTALAVLCHELPHELGDFAVLLKAGMSPKKAICYNVLTGILCLVGMVTGVIIGDTPETSQYVFAGTAGLFLYIALVDMIPELTSSHGKEGNCMLLICSLQFSGMLIGLLSMLFIAIYEHDLMEVFNSKSS